MSPPPPSIPILDNHAHLDPAGLHIEAVRRFERSGGTHLIVSHKPYEHLPVLEGKDYQAQFQQTLDLVERANKGTGVKVFATVGPYPVDYIEIAKKRGETAAKAALMEGMEHAKRLVVEGKAIAIGEIGRPHFPVPAEVLEASNEIMRYGMELAREAGCPVVLHTEGPGTDDHMKAILEMSRKAGLKDHMVVKHFSPPKLVDPRFNPGATPSLVARTDSVVKALKTSKGFLLETDYIDSLERPDAVLPPETVPTLTRTLLQSGQMSEEAAMNIHHDLPSKVYGIDIAH